MLDAICLFDEDTNNEKVFSIFEFKAMPESEIDKLRYSLLCPICRQKAYFRKASKDGKQACFGSRYHEIDCEEFNPSVRKSEEQKQVIEVEALLLEVDSLQIDFNAPISSKRVAKKEAEITAKNEPQKVSSTNSSKALKQESELNVNKQGLKKLLVSLLRGSSLG